VVLYYSCCTSTTTSSLFEVILESVSRRSSKLRKFGGGPKQKGIVVPVFVRVEITVEVVVL
jgi:hypothetical protein